MHSFGRAAEALQWESPLCHAGAAHAGRVVVVRGANLGGGGGAGVLYCLTPDTVQAEQLQHVDTRSDVSLPPRLSPDAAGAQPSCTCRCAGRRGGAGSRGSAMA